MQAIAPAAAQPLLRPRRCALLRAAAATPRQAPFISFRVAAATGESLAAPPPPSVTSPLSALLRRLGYRGRDPSLPPGADTLPAKVVALLLRTPTPPIGCGGAPGSRSCLAAVIVLPSPSPPPELRLAFALAPSLLLSAYVPQPVTWLHRLDPRVKQAWLLLLLLLPLRATLGVRAGLGAALAALSLATFPGRVSRPQLKQLAVLCGGLFLFTSLGADSIKSLTAAPLPPAPWEGLPAAMPPPLAPYAYTLLEAGPIAITRRGVGIGASAAAATFCILQSTWLLQAVTAPEVGGGGGGGVSRPDTHAVCRLLTSVSDSLPLYMGSLLPTSKPSPASRSSIVTEKSLHRTPLLSSSLLLLPRQAIAASLRWLAQPLVWVGGGGAAAAVQEMVLGLLLAVRGGRGRGKGGAGWRAYNFRAGQVCALSFRQEVADPL